MVCQCSILVLSCDKNKNVLNIFFDMFFKNWKDCEWPVYVGVEKEQVEFNGVQTLYSENKYWSGRVKEYLKQINTKHVLIVLDDFLIEKKVDETRVEDIFRIISQSDCIANIALADIYDTRNGSTTYPNLVERRKNANYLLNMQMGFWKKDILEDLLSEKESPWETEIFGSIRARKYDNYQFLCLDSDDNMPIKYNRGWFVVRGAWNADEIMRLDLWEYAPIIFDGRPITYFGYKIKQPMIVKRITTRVRISFRQACSWAKKYY